MSIVFTNNSSTTLASAILYTDVSFTVATGTGSTFPAISGGDVAYITLTDGSTLEIVKVTGRSGDIFTCVRGQDGTTAVPWASGTTVQLRTTAAALTGMMQKANNLSDLANAGNARTNLGVAIGSNVQAWDADLDAIAALTALTGVLRKTATNTWTLDTTIISGSSLTNNGVVYANGSGQATSGSALTFDGTNLSTTGRLNTGAAIGMLLDNVAGTQILFRYNGSAVGEVGTSNQIISGGSTTDFAIDTRGASSNLVFGINTSEQMRLTSTGLGIGTSSPNLLSWNKAETLNTASGNAAYELAIGGVAQAYFAADATNVYLAAYANKPLLVRTNNATVATFDTSGNLGLGVTPSAWESTAKALQFGSLGFVGRGNSGQTLLGYNNYINSSGQSIYLATTQASKYEQIAGEHRFYSAPSGTAGNAITFSQAMTLDASGNLVVGATSATTRLSVVKASSGAFTPVADFSNGTGTARFVFGNAAYGDIPANKPWLHSYDDLYIGSDGVTSINFVSSAVLRARIDSSGNLLVGTTTVGGKITSTSTTTTPPLYASTSGVGRAGQFMSTAGADSAVFGLYVGKFANDTTTSQRFIGFSINNDTNGSGQINANGASQAAFGSFSDARLKENIVDLPPQLEKIMALRPVEFDYRDGSGHQTGFVAQDMEIVYPDAVGEADGFKTVTGWNKTEARLVKAIQEQQALIESLTARLATLESK